MSSQPGRIHPPVTRASIASAKASAHAELQQSAVAIATAKGHSLGRWYDLTDDGAAVAYCRGCRARAVIDSDREPRLAGDALRVVCTRPDAFLAHQHPADVNGGGR